MKFLVCMLALTISAALAVMPHGNGFGGGWGGGMVISRRDADAADTADAADDAADASDDAAEADDDAESEQPDLYSEIDALLAAAKEGITVDDFGLAAVKIQTAADMAVDAQGGVVEAEEVQAAIDDAASAFSGIVAVSSLFDEPLVYEANKMDAALCLLNSLSKKARAQEEARESSKATVAAISMTVQAMQDILTDTVGIIAYNADLANSKNVDKRWKVSGHYNRDPFGGVSYGASISHSWDGRRKRSAVQRTKRGRWSAGANVNRGPHGGYSVGASVSYSWGR
ncbi:hypothetical protein PoB_002393000 [Plakobranchus ocellatus]|uniref:Uncharacterized protein n=1 Tax=Plakobranchus ocellatus TaxID=259542 RepID=A0AAV3ZQL4_9GAST|nr:hypothetical protein PoB_002393000 [Plakobranchus ocellatus]